MESKNEVNCGREAISEDKQRVQFAILRHLVTHLGVREIVIGLECRVEGCDQVEQRLTRDGVAQRNAFITGVASTAEEWRHVSQCLWR